MALIFSPGAKGANGFVGSLAGNAPWLLGAATLLIYPSTVAMPANALSLVAINNVNPAPTGWILSFTIGSSITQSGGIISFTGTAKSATTTAAGTLSWWCIAPVGGQSAGAPYNTRGIIGDAVTTPGNGGIVILSTITPTLGQSVTWSGFNLTIV